MSISGKEYIPSDEPVGSKNLVTVDLSPCIGNVWGDYARSFVVEDGIYTNNPHRSEFSNGLSLELKLHDKMKEFVSPETKFSDFGWENLDFLENLGHSIETKPEERRFIDSHGKSNETPHRRAHFSHYASVPQRGIFVKIFKNRCLYLPWLWEARNVIVPYKAFFDIEKIDIAGKNLWLWDAKE